MGWGRYPTTDGHEVCGENLEALSAEVTLSRGLGRSYGDASLPATPQSRVLNTTRADRLLRFDPETGVLNGEAGLSLAALNWRMLAEGWAVPVVPGTQFVTLGGMVASDVHGKNHHVAGSFGEHVRSLRMRVADGRILEVSESSEPELFRATLGGMGLTGHILEVELRMQRIPSPWIVQESERVADLDALLAALGRASRAWPFTVAWVDALARGRGLGRGIVYAGRWAEPAEAPPDPPRPRRRLSVPFDLPNGTLNRASVGLFNRLIFHKHRPRLRRRIVHPETFFYPLDRVRNWNRVYGCRGFTQYQCVLPASDDPSLCRRFFERLHAQREAALLCVLKDFGAEGKGLISFPRPGITISLDLPVRGARTQACVDALNEFVIEAGGRIYLSKDAFTRAQHLRAMDPRLPAFEAVRKRWDPELRIRSAQSVRLLGDPT